MTDCTLTQRKGRKTAMRRLFTTIGIIAAMGIMIITSYLLGATQAETETEIQTVTEIREVEKPVEVVPDGFIDTSSAEFQDNYIDMRSVIDFSVSEYGLQLYFEDGTGYWLER